MLASLSSKNPPKLPITSPCYLDKSTVCTLFPPCSCSCGNVEMVGRMVGISSETPSKWSRRALLAADEHLRSILLPIHPPGPPNRDQGPIRIWAQGQFAFGPKDKFNMRPPIRIWEVLFVLWFGRLDDHPPRPQPRYRPMDLEEFVIYCSDLQRPIRCNLGAYLVVFESTKPTDPSSMAQMIWGMNS